MRADCLRLHYCPERNFGDVLGKQLVESMSGRPAAFSKSIRGAELVAVGSVLYFGHSLYCLKSELPSAYGLRQLAKRLLLGEPHVKVWGSGFMFPRAGELLLRLCNLDVRCVRGLLTRDALRERGFLAPGQKVAVGDPGLLFPFLLKEQVKCECEIGVVAHYKDVEAGRALVSALRKSGADAHFIDVTQPDALGVVREIGSCATILSSSLHGLIVADAFGIPNRHVCFSDLGISSDGFSAEAALFKFRDYFSAVRRPYCPIADAKRLIEDPSLCRNLVVKGDVASGDLLEELRDGLIRSFPLAVVDDWRRQPK